MQADAVQVGIKNARFQVKKVLAGKTAPMNLNPTFDVSGKLKFAGMDGWYVMVWWMLP